MIRLTVFLSAGSVIGFALSAGCSATTQDDVAARIHAFETGFRPTSAVGDSLDTLWTIEERMAHHRVPGVSVAVLRNGKLAWAKAYGLKQAGTTDSVDTETVFSVGSVSKLGTAAAVLRLVDQGKLDLDRHVNEYLTRWRVPQNEFTVDSLVTLRRIMSHTAGFTVHGFGDFQPGEPLPDVVDVLEGRPPAKNAPVRIFLVPGTEFRYSGGGTTVTQLLIEEVTAVDFTAATRALVFNPLEMTRSTYENPLPAAHENIASAHGPDGEPRALPRGWEAMPETAASGLWTTPSDFAQVLIALITSYQDGEGSFISFALARDMMTRVEPGAYGLGPNLPEIDGFRIFRHGGSNNSYKAYVEGDLGSGNGVVIFTNAANGADLHEEVRLSIAYAEGWPIEVAEAR